MRILAMSTINQKGMTTGGLRVLHPGSLVFVDTDLEKVKVLLRNEYLVPEPTMAPWDLEALLKGDAGGAIGDPVEKDGQDRPADRGTGDTTDHERAGDPGARGGADRADDGVPAEPPAGDPALDEREGTQGQLTNPGFEPDAE